MKKVLWFSRHAMTAAQLSDLRRALGGGDLHVTQVSGSAQNVHVPFEAQSPEQGETVADTVLVGPQPPLKELLGQFDEAAVVLPINLIQQALPFAPAGRLLQAVNARILGEGGKVTFQHTGWDAIKEVRIVTERI